MMELSEESSEQTGKDKTSSRIQYTKEFLLSCQKYVTKGKLKGLSKDLDCILKSSRNTSIQHPQFTAPQRKKEGEGDISLRPHSGNFSSGCLPNSNHGFSRFSLEENKSDRDRDRDGYRDRERERNSNRFGNFKDQNGRYSERDKERGRGMDDKDYRMQNRRTYNMQADYDSEDWDRRRRPMYSGYSDRETKYRNGRNDNERENRGRHDEEEQPSWFTEPMSRHDTIELTGGPPELKGFKGDDMMPNELNGWGKDDDRDSSETEKSASRKQSDDSVKNDGFGENIEKFLHMEKLPDFFDSLPQSTKPNTSQSKFAGFFEANTKRAEAVNHVTEDKSVKPTEQDLKKSMGDALRSILLVGPQSKPGIKTESTKVSFSHMEKPLHPKDDHMKMQNKNLGDQAALGQLLNQMVKQSQEKVNQSTNQSQGEFHSQLERSNSRGEKNLTFSRNQPSSNGPGDVTNEMYNDPLHPFTRLVKDLESGLRLQTPSQPQIGDARMEAQASEAKRPSIPQTEQRSMVFPEPGFMPAQVPQPMFMHQQMRFNPSQQFALNNGMGHRAPQPIPGYRQPSMHSAYPGGYIPFVGGQAVPQNPHFGLPQTFVPNQGMHIPVTSHHVPSANGQGINPMALFHEQLRSNTQQHPSFTPGQVLALLPPDVQYMITSVVISPDIIAQPEPMRFLNSIKDGSISLNDLLQKINSRTSPPQAQSRELIYVALKLCLQGVIPIRGLVVPNQGNNRQSPIAFNSNPMGQQFAAHGLMGALQRQHQPRGQRPQHDVSSARSVASQLQFTPTAVMSYMSTQEQQSRSSGIPQQRQLENPTHK